MKLVYIAGPLRANSIYQYGQNILNAEKVMIKWLKNGASVICPHRNTGFLDGVFGESDGTLENMPDVADDFWLRVDFEQIKRCDAIIMCKGWEKSKGSTAEHNFAEEQGIPIIYELH